MCVCVCLCVCKLVSDLYVCASVIFMCMSVQIRNLRIYYTTIVFPLNKYCSVQMYIVGGSSVYCSQFNVK